ncbi:MAG: hypothetical protein WBL93_01425 [Lutisporaceae bacterium]
MTHKLSSWNKRIKENRRIPSEMRYRGNPKRLPKEAKNKNTVNTPILQCKDIDSSNKTTLKSDFITQDNINKTIDYKSHESLPFTEKNKLDKKTSIIEEVQKIMSDENVTVNTSPTCATGEDPNCAECCAIFTNTATRAAFGYQLEAAACECHDICVEDVRDICVKRRTLRHIIPCRAGVSAGCRGGALPDVDPGDLPVPQSWRVLCARECLNPPTCDRIINEVEFEVRIRYGTNTFGVITPRDTFDCRFNEFARFPSAVFYPNNAQGFNQWRNELSLIDGSCKVVIIEDVSVESEDNNCVLVIDYKVIDKLWKRENLLVSALRPYQGNGENSITNVTVDEIFEQGHRIGPCSNGLCGGA